MGPRILKDLSREERWKVLSPFLKENGIGCMAYSTLQDGLEYFVDANLGYIAYYPLRFPFLTLKTNRIVLADPIAKKEDYERLVEQFLNQRSPAIFLQATTGFAELLVSYGFKVNQIGIETEIELAHFDLKGKQKAALRQWRNKAIREGVEVMEKDISEMDSSVVRGVSDNWLKKRGGHELYLLTRPLVYGHEEDVRYFWAVKNNDLVGMVIFDPMYGYRKIRGYYHNFVRLSDKAPYGTSVLATITAISQFQSEGIERVSLGMSPLCKLEDDKFKRNKNLSRIFRFMYSHCGFLYPFQGNHFHKSKYHGDESPVYFSCTEGNSVMSLLRAMKSLKIF